MSVGGERNGRGEVEGTEWVGQRSGRTLGEVMGEGGEDGRRRRTHMVVVLGVEGGGDGHETTEGGEHPAPMPSSISRRALENWRNYRKGRRKGSSLGVCSVLGNLVGDVNVANDRSDPGEAGATACRTRRDIS